VVQFILQQTAEAGLAGGLNDMPVTGGGVDPFTGGGARGGDYSISTVSNRAAFNASPAASSVPFSVTGGDVDPFTGGGRTQGQKNTAGEATI
jgi:hypothetical protein